MKKLTLNYVCFALSALCVLFMSCKDDDVPYPIGKKLVNYEITLIHLEADAPEPSSLPKDCIVYRDHEVLDNCLYLSFFYEGNKYLFDGLSASEIRILNVDNSYVKVLLSGEFVPYNFNGTPFFSTGSGKYSYKVSFTASSITLKQ